VRPTEPESKPGFFDFIGWRRQVLSDRTWFGVALVVMGIGVPISEGGWAWLVAFLLLPGVILVKSGVRRASNRVDRTTGERRPGPPWWGSTTC
jgi:hypothetical protein